MQACMLGMSANDGKSAPLNPYAPTRISMDMLWQCHRDTDDKGKLLKALVAVKQWMNLRPCKAQEAMLYIAHSELLHGVNDACAQATEHEKAEKCPTIMSAYILANFFACPNIVSNASWHACKGLTYANGVKLVDFPFMTWEGGSHICIHQQGANLMPRRVLENRYD